MECLGFPIKQKIKDCFFIIACNPCKLLKDYFYTQISDLAAQDLMHLFLKKKKKKEKRSVQVSNKEGNRYICKVWYKHGKTETKKNKLFQNMSWFCCKIQVSNLLWKAFT